MSYCRFSDCDWKSDVYVYESVEGWTIHVATHRFVGEIPTVPPLQERLCLDLNSFMEADRLQMQAVKSAERVPIGGRNDGKTFLYDTPRECWVALIHLRSDGYFVPRHATDCLKREVDEWENPKDGR